MVFLVLDVRIQRNSVAYTAFDSQELSMRSSRTVLSVVDLNTLSSLLDPAPQTCIASLLV